MTVSVKCNDNLKQEKAMTHSKRTPIETHTEKCFNEECQKSHTNANTTGQVKPMSASTSELDTKLEHALSAENQMSKNNGKKIGEGSSQDTAASVNVAEKVSQDFSRLTTFMVQGHPSAGMESVVGGFINGLLKTASLENIIDCFVTTAIALEGSTGNAPTKNNARLIAAAPELLEALEKCRELAAKGSKFAGDLTRDVIEQGLSEIDAVIAKARGQA